MPPKRTTAASTTATKKTTTKAKAVKKTVDKENPEKQEDHVSDENQKAKATKKRVRENETQEEESDKKVKKNSAKKEKTTQQSKSDKDVAAKKKTVAKAGTSKEKSENKVDSASNKENGTIKKTRTTKIKNNESEKPSKVPAVKKTATTKAKRGKAAEVEADEETPVEPTKDRKRKPATKTKSQKDEPETKSLKLMNSTSTNWEEIDFKCSSKNSKGNGSNFHITSWNVDGVRAWLKKGGLNILKYDDPDIFCIQETKCNTEKLPEEVKSIEGYEVFWRCSDKEGYAGVGIATKIKPLSVTYGINSEEHDGEGRCITVEYEKFFLVNVYVPNAGRKLVTLPKRLDWNDMFKTHIKNLDTQKPVIVCGDMNVAHQEIDLANPKTNTKNAGFTVEERQGLTDFLADGYVDSFRKLYPEKEKAYTFWTYMAGARTKNVGWRLDYFIVSERLMDQVCDNIILKDVLGSDHCPLALHLNI